jgi:hypothetical protein
MSAALEEVALSGITNNLLSLRQTWLIPGDLCVLQPHNLRGPCWEKSIRGGPFGRGPLGVWVLAKWHPLGAILMPWQLQKIRERSDSELFTIPIDYETARNRPFLRIETLHSLRNLRLPVPYVLKSPD